MPQQKFEPRPFGKTGSIVGPLGVASSYGVSARAVEEAFERGVSYFYWGWARRSGMRDGLRSVVRRHRDKVFITIPSLMPGGVFVRQSVTRAIRALGCDYIDGLHFFLFKNRPPWRSQTEPALKLREEGLIRHIGFSSHHRPNFARFCHEPFSEFCHVRYNAIHRGAEEDVFPRIPPKGDPARPGIVAFTATSWGQLIKADPAKLGGLKPPTAGDCYRFALSNPGVDVCVTGPSTDEQARHAFDAIDKGPMTEQELEWMREVGDRLRR